MAILDTLGEHYNSHLRGGFPASCGFLSRSNTALPHGLTENRRLERGDILITGAYANIGGYRTELERTMFIGEVPDHHQEYFEQMCEMQELAIETMGPGVPAAEVDQVVHDYCKSKICVHAAPH